LWGDKKSVYVVGAEVVWHVEVGEKSNFEKKNNLGRKKEGLHRLVPEDHFLPSENEP
jgi:hypothetical protein